MTFTGHVLEELPPSEAAGLDGSVGGWTLSGRPAGDFTAVGRPVNQRFHFLTGRYDESIFTTPNRLELTIAPDGGIELNGFATTEVLEALLSREGKPLMSAHAQAAHEALAQLDAATIAAHAQPASSPCGRACGHRRSCWPAR